MNSIDWDKITGQLVFICLRIGRNIQRTNFEIILTQLKKPL